jgi:hypothetical protein
LASHSPYPVQRQPQGGIRKFSGTIQQSDDTPLNAVVANPGASREVSRADHVHGTDLSGLPGTGGIVGWCINSVVIAPQSNPTAATYIHAHRIWTPNGLNFKAYGIGLTRAGVKTDGNLYLSIWTDDADNICPAEEYESARVLCFANGKVAGWNRLPLQARGVSDVAIAPGFAWVIKTIEVYAGRTELPIDWWDGFSAGNGSALAIALTGHQGAFPKAPWDFASSVGQRATPAVYLLSS